MYWPNLIKFFFLLSALLVFSVTTTRVSELSESHQQLVNDLLQVSFCRLYRLRVPFPNHLIPLARIDLSMQGQSKPF